MLAAVTLSGAACGDGGTSATPTSSATVTPDPAGGELTITAWPAGRAHGTVVRRTLSCAPIGGTVPDAAAACAVLAAHPEALQPIPADRACTEIYGGPAEALITGRWGAAAVRLHVSRTDGCRIARWDLLQPLLPEPASWD